MYDYGYASETSSSMLGVMSGLFFGIMIFSSIISLIIIISYAKLFKKAGKSWWASIIPIYNYIVMIEIAKLPMWYIALFFVPIANIYAIFKINIEMAKKFGKSAGFGVGMTLLNIIFVPLLAFSDDKYEDEINVSNNNNNNNSFDARNVINSGNSVDVPIETQNVNITAAPIENINVSQTENIVEPASVENIEVAPVENIVEPAPLENIIEPASMENIEVAPVENIVEPAPLENVEVAPLENIVEPAPVENVEVAPLENIVEPAPVENVVEPIQVENETINDNQTLNAFNITPEPVPVENKIVETMVQEPEVIETIMPTELTINSTESDLAVNVAEDKKLCKNCGNELPDIVSICPNCGTDNE